jgi:hypothetical protein
MWDVAQWWNLACLGPEFYSSTTKKKKVYMPLQIQLCEELELLL